MSIKKATPVLPYAQIPHFVLTHTKLDSDHKIIFTMIYDVLRSKEYCTHSNSKILEAVQLSSRTLDKKLQDLENLGLVRREGCKQNRRFYLGDTVQKLLTYAKNDSYMRNNCGCTPYIDYLKNNLTGGIVDKPCENDPQERHDQYQAYISGLRH